MLQINAAQMQMFEDRAWGETARQVPQDLSIQARQDRDLAALYNACPPEELQAIVDDAVAAARASGFRFRTEVVALAKFFLRYGRSTGREPLAERKLDPLSRIAVMTRLAEAAAAGQEG